MDMLTYLICSKLETDRIQNIQLLHSQLKNLVEIEAIYPSHQHIPFKKRILETSFKRTKRQIKMSELGLLMSQRKAWERFLLSKEQTALFLESDSLFNDLTSFNNYSSIIHDNYDIFFWGAFDGRMKIYKKNQIYITDNYVIGNPVINSLYCTYGYSLNRKAAEYLLKQTKTINYPVDYWKFRLKHGNLKIGGIYPEIISTNQNYKSTIQDLQFNIFKLKFVQKLIDCKNSVKAYLNA